MTANNGVSMFKYHQQKIFIQDWIARTEEKIEKLPVDERGNLVAHLVKLREELHEVEIKYEVCKQAYEGEVALAPF